MNRQPYCKPPRWWAPKLSIWCVRLTRGYRQRQLRSKQQIVEIDLQGEHHLRASLDQGHGVLLTPNHSAHYDSAALYIAADRLNLQLHFMTAWQVFGMSSRWEQWAMQRLGCFSIDRESTDRQAFKTAVNILQSQPAPLVIFPEGDIYHTTDRVTPFREGAAAIALSAARRNDRPVDVVPCGIKFWYVDDPQPKLRRLAAEIESRLYLRPGDDMSLVDRIHRLAEAALALKELDYLGRTRSGRVRDRIAALIEDILVPLEAKHGLSPASDGTVPARVKALRQSVISQLEGRSPPLSCADSNHDTNSHHINHNGAALTASQTAELTRQMEDLFLVMQLFSYPGDYLVENPRLERVAETLDKFEEDILGRDLPAVRGKRRIVIRFGTPIQVAPRGRNGVAALTMRLQCEVQTLIDQM